MRATPSSFVPAATWCPARSPSPTPSSWKVSAEGHTPELPRVTRFRRHRPPPWGTASAPERLRGVALCGVACWEDEHLGTRSLRRKLTVQAAGGSRKGSLISRIESIPRDVFLKLSIFSICCLLSFHNGCRYIGAWFLVLNLNYFCGRYRSNLKLDQKSYLNFFKSSPIVTKNFES